MRTTRAMLLEARAAAAGRPLLLQARRATHVSAVPRPRRRLGQQACVPLPCPAATWVLTQTTRLPPARGVAVVSGSRAALAARRRRARAPGGAVPGSGATRSQAPGQPGAAVGQSSLLAGRRVQGTKVMAVAAVAAAGRGLGQAARATARASAQVWVPTLAPILGPALGHALGPTLAPILGPAPDAIPTRTARTAWL